MSQAGKAAPPAPGGASRVPGWALLFIGAWGFAAPYAGKALGLVVVTRPIVEVVDHVVPGLVVLAMAIASIVTRRISLPAAFLVSLAGLWMTATHVPLVAQALRGGVDMKAALFHSIPGAMITVLGVMALVFAWSDSSVFDTTSSGTHID